MNKATMSVGREQQDHQRRSLFNATDAVSRKLISNQLSPIPVPKGIATLEHIRNGTALPSLVIPTLARLARSCGMTGWSQRPFPPFVTYVVKFRDRLRTGDQRRLVT